MSMHTFVKSLTSTRTRRQTRRGPLTSRLCLEALEGRVVPVWSGVELGTLGGARSEATDLNASAQVVGWSEQADGAERAYLWRNGVMTNLGTLGGDFSRAFGINDSGQVVGMSRLATGAFAYRAFLLTPEDTDGNGTPDRWFRDSNADGANDLMRNLGTLGGSNPTSRAEDVNDLGQVVGTSSWDTQSGVASRAFLWQNGVMSDLGTLGGSTSQAINDAGQITCSSSNSTFLWTNGVMTNLGGSYGANDINGAGQLVGSDFGRGRLWTPAVPNGSTGTFTELGFLPPIWPDSAVDSFPLGINSTSQVVGYQSDFSGGEFSIGLAFRGYRWASGVLEELPLEFAVAINDAGQIAGNTGGRAVLLTPIPLDLPLVTIS